MNSAKALCDGEADRLSQQGQEQMIRPLLDCLASGGPQAGGSWQDWQVTRIAGGRNNLLYRTFGPLGDLAIKFTIRDGRDRVGREFGALSVLRQAGLPVAPEPILLDRTSYDQPVVVQSWLKGKVSTVPPATEGEWQALVQHLATIHTITPDGTHFQLPWATINANDAEEGRQRVWEQVTRIPTKAQPASLGALLRQLEASRFPEWPDAPVTLCRLDNNISNYIRRPGRWASVDWEYSGWGDPAFDVANMVTHVAYKEVSSSRWDWVVDAYCDLVEDMTASLRIRVYCKILVVWWLARLARYLYEIPTGLDERLSEWPEGWQADIEAKYEHYLGLAEAAYS